MELPGVFGLARNMQDSMDYLEEGEQCSPYRSLMKITGAKMVTSIRLPLSA